LSSETSRLRVELMTEPGSSPWPPVDWASSLEQAVLSTVTDWYELGTGADKGVRLLLGPAGL